MPAVLTFQALASPDDAALALLAPSLSERFVAAQAAVAAIPERPVTSSFLVAKPLPATKSLRAKGAAELLGVLAVICVAEVRGSLCAFSGAWMSA